jgi:hypothetical protein
MFEEVDPCHAPKARRPCIRGTESCAPVSAVRRDTPRGFRPRAGIARLLRRQAFEKCLQIWANARSSVLPNEQSSRRSRQKRVKSPDCSVRGLSQSRTSRVISTSPCPRRNPRKINELTDFVARDSRLTWSPLAVSRCARPRPSVRLRPAAASLEPYRRQIAPIRNPSPRAKATVDSGRSRTVSSTVSASEEACDCVALAAAPTRFDASATIESTVAPACLRAYFRPRFACSCAAAPRSLVASAI